MKKSDDKKVIRNMDTVSVGIDASSESCSERVSYKAASSEEYAKEKTLHALERDCAEMSSDERKLYDLQSLIEIGFPISSEETAENIRKSVLEYMITDEKNFLRRRKHLMDFLNMQESFRSVESIKKSSEVLNKKEHSSIETEENTLTFSGNDAKDSDGFRLQGSDEFSFSVLPDCYYFRLPELTNYYSESRNYQSAMTGRFIQKMMVDVLDTYKSEYGALEKFDKFFAVFVLHYTDGTKKDTDNFDIKKPIDAINGILIENDDVSRSHILLTSVKDETAFTELYIYRGHDMEKQLVSFSEKA